MLLKRIGIFILLMNFYTLVKAQVNLQTGSAVFSLPMFNWQDDKSRLTSVVALSYNSGNGLKVNDVASNVGQGWSLVAGGVITRMQVGEPDDQKPYMGTTQYGNGNEQDMTKYPAGYLYGPAASADGCPTAATKYPIYGGKNVLYKPHNAIAQDMQLDYFSFQFNGKSGQFIVDTTAGDHGMVLGDSKLKITFQRDPTMISQGIRTTITSFSIQDVDGLIYKFTLHGLTKLLNSTFCNWDGSMQWTQPTIKNKGVYCQCTFDLGPTASPWVNKYIANPFIISSWYLSEIDDPLTSRRITFSYNSLNLNNAAGSDISHNSGANNYAVVSYKKSVTTALEISNIVYPDGHQVYFTYPTSPRIDFPGEFPLSQVTVTYQGRYLSRYQLNTSYFILNRRGTPSNAYEKSVARLCLRSVKKIGVDLKEDTPPYIFDYYTGSDAADDFVPPPFFYAKDIWGYYNGNKSIVSTSNPSSPVPITLYASKPSDLDYPSLRGLCFINDYVTGSYYNAKPGYAQNGLLKTITYPTGGSLGYQYTQNTGIFINGSVVNNVGGVHVSQTSSLDGGYSNGCGTPVVTQYNYVMNGTGSASSLWGLEQPNNAMVTNNNYREERMTIHFSFSNPLGTCLWHYVYPGIMEQYEAVSIDMIQKLMTVLAPVLGVLSVISDVMDVINLCSMGTPLAIIAVVLDVIAAVLGYILSCPRITKYTTSTTNYNFDLNSISPLPAQFKRVEITESPGTIGKTVELFTNGDDSDPLNRDYQVWFGVGGNSALSAKQRFAPWAYGLPKLITQYDVSGHKIKETQNVYDFRIAQYRIGDPIDGICNIKRGNLDVQACKCLVVTNNSQRSDDWSKDNGNTYINDNSLTNDMKIDIYNVYSGSVLLDTTYERVYRTTDATQFIQTETDYNYNSFNCIPYNFDVNLIRTTQSNGDVSYKSIKYTVDYNTGVLATMVSNNMASIPVATSTYVIKAGNPTQQYLNEKVTEFTRLSNGDIKPSRIIEQRFAQPSSTFTAYSGPTTTNYAAYKIPQQFTYDVNGNLTGLKDEGGRSVTNIYDYNDKYITASVINTDPSVDKCAYSSFESQDLSRSGWTLTGTASYLPYNLSPTGANVFTLLSTGRNSLACTSLNTAKPYILSFWSNGTGLTITGGPILRKSAPIYSGYTYYEYSIMQGSLSVTITNNTGANINIDELRLYPSRARMSTTTYDPLIGKTSACDENNRITYYTYDNLGRMQFIEDETRNIVKMYEYNNVSAARQTGCPATYYNHFTYEIFSRNNCAVRHRGSDVPYTITAGKYSSAISQADADIQAEIELLTLAQNNANTSGRCDSVFVNVYESATDTTQSCADSLTGGLVTYAVPAGTYSSIISQADANQQALDDISANAQSFANNPPNAVCTISNVPDWEWFPGDTASNQPPDSSYCLSVNGQLPPHQFVLATDKNPHSPTYNQKQYWDYGPTSACPANTYFSAARSQAFTKNCAGGSIVYYTVPPGKYYSTASQAAADLLATNEINLKGQHYADSLGNCCLPAFNYASNISGIIYTSVSITGTTVNFVFVFTYPSLGSSFTLGYITPSCCFPTAARVVPIILGSNVFNVTINTNGMVTVQLVSGTAPSGSVGLQGVFDLQSVMYYSAAASGTFTRNNCTGGQVGNSVTYSVAAYQYHSTVNQAAADQLAQNDVTNNGQNYANTNGTCSIVCGFNWTSTITNHPTTSVTSPGTTVNFNLTFVAPTNGYTGGTIGTITGGCIPTGTRSMTLTDGSNSSRTWFVSITATGSVSVSLSGGPAPTNSYPPVVLIGSFTK